MHSLDSLFLSTKQPQKKLEIAISRFFVDGADPNGQYRLFLKKRLRPAILWIIRNGSVQMLTGLLNCFTPNEALMLEAVRLCSSLGRAEMTAILLKTKQSEAETSVPFLISQKSLCERILEHESLKIYQDRPFFGRALAQLSFRPSPSGETGTDGIFFFYDCDSVIRYFLDGRLRALLLHTILHCLFLHILPPANATRTAWDKACDEFADEALAKLDPESTYHVRDSHTFWYRRTDTPCTSDHCGGDSSDPSLSHTQLKEKWGELRRQFSHTKKRSGISNRGITGGSMTEWVILRENGRYDFRRYLRRLCISAEEMQIDPDSIDPIPYHYGLQLLKNMPLIEPLETAEVSKILELVIAIDTSGSCSLPVVQRFLDEICSLLSEQEYFFRKIRVHLIQCDCVIQDHRIITSLEAWKQESHSLKIQGRGGTDFTPVFSYIEKLQKEKQINHLKGLLYFTDGDGIYPQKQTSYETAFVFSDKKFLDLNVPKWIIPLCFDNSPILP